MLCVNEVGGEFPFALDVNYSSESHAVSHAFDHLGRLLRHLGAERKELGQETMCGVFLSPVIHPLIYQFLPQLGQ